MAKILIVDEAEIFLKLERSFLRRSGFELLVAHTPEQLILKVRGERPDLVLLHSQGQSGRCGIPCARRLKADPETSHIPIILICPPGASADGDPIPCERVLDAPVDPHDLLDAVSFLVRVQHRVHPRLHVSVPVEINAGASSLRGHTKDLSLTGLFVLTRRPLEEGVPVRVSVTLPTPEGSSVILAGGRVVRGVADDPLSHLVPGNGVSLSDLDERGKRALEEFVARQGATP